MRGGYVGRGDAHRWLLSARATCRTENVINPKARRQAKPGMLRLTQSILLVSQHHRYTPPKRLRPSQVHGKSPPPLALWHRQGTRLTYIYRYGKLKLRRRGVVESHACHGVVVLHVRQDAVAASYLDKITSADGAVGQKGRGRGALTRLPQRFGRHATCSFPGLTEALSGRSTHGYSKSVVILSNRWTKPHESKLD